MKRTFADLALFFVGAILIPAVGPQTASADLVCRLCPFNCEDTGADDPDCGDKIMRRNGKCCVDLDDRGLDALKETDRRRYHEGYYGAYGNRPAGHDYSGGYNNGYHNPYYTERNPYSHDRDGGYNSQGWNRGDSRRNDPGAYDDRNGYQPGDCPSGYHVNERACNADERRRGCNDLRSRSGQICVGWGH